MRNLIVFAIALFSTTLSFGQYVEMPDGLKLDTTVVYHEPTTGIGDSLHVVGYNSFMRVEIDVVFIEYSGMTNFIARDKADHLWLVIRTQSRDTGWFCWELVDLEDLDYRIRYYDTQRL